MQWTRRLMILAAALAVVGFVCVAIGAPRETTPDPGDTGWFAYAPEDAVSIAADPQAAYSSTLVVTTDARPIMHVGIALVILAFLLTAGIIGRWAHVRRED